MPKKPTIFRGGLYVEFTDAGPRIVGPPPPGFEPRAVVCRRLEDVPLENPMRDIASRGACSRCAAVIVFNPNNPFPKVEKICLQCAQIQPLPLETP